MQNLNHALTEIDVMLPPKQYIEKILQVTCDNLDYLFGTLIEVDGEGEAHMVASYDFPEIYPELVNQVTVPILSSPSGEAFETGKIVVLHDPFSDPRLKPWDNVRIIMGSLETMIWVPLFKKGKVFGIFVLYSDIRREISDQELSILEQVGVMISIAIASNQYLDKLTQRTKELENGIAERKKNENKLQKMHVRLEIMVEEKTSELSEANKKLHLFRYLINQSNDVMFVTEPQTALILDANEKACTSLGYSREELLCMKVIDFEMKIQDIDSWKDHVDKIMMDNCQIINESVYKRKNGTTFPVEVNVKLFTQNEKDYLVVVIHDMTKRKQVEKALWVSNEKYHSLTDDVLNSSAVGIFILDSHLKVVWVNQALEDYFGLKKNEIIGKDKRQLIRERIKDIFEDPDSFANKVFNTYDDNTYVEHFECHVLPNNKRKERWLEHRSRPIQSGFYAGGRIEHYYDITERKQAEKDLKLNEARLEALLKISHMKEGTIKEIADFVLQKGIELTESKIGYLSVVSEDENIQTVLSYSKDVMEQCNLNNQIEFITEDMGLVGECIRKRKPIIINDYSKSHSDKNGYPDAHLPLVRYLSIPLFYKGKIVAIMSVANKEDEYNDSDIQQLTLLMNGMWEHIKRIEFEEELVATKNYLDMIISMSSDGIFVIDDEGKFEFCNDACVEISGYQKSEYIGKSFMGLIPEEYTQFMLDRWHEAQAGECEPYEIIILRKDGTRRNLLVSRGNFMLNNKQKHCVIIKDVTTDYAGYIDMILKDMKKST